LLNIISINDKVHEISKFLYPVSNSTIFSFTDDFCITHNNHCKVHKNRKKSGKYYI